MLAQHVCFNWGTTTAVMAIRFMQPYLYVSTKRSHPGAGVRWDTSGFCCNIYPPEEGSQLLWYDNNIDKATFIERQHIYQTVAFKCKSKSVHSNKRLSTAFNISREDMHLERHEDFRSLWKISVPLIWWSWRRKELRNKRGATEEKARSPQVSGVWGTSRGVSERDPALQFMYLRKSQMYAGARPWGVLQVKRMSL